MGVPSHIRRALFPVIYRLGTQRNADGTVTTTPDEAAAYRRLVSFAGQSEWGDYSFQRQRQWERTPPMSDFHLKAEIPEGATTKDVTDIRAGAFRTALTHAATDPAIRLKMLLGEA